MYIPVYLLIPIYIPERCAIEVRFTGLPLCSRRVAIECSVLSVVTNTDFKVFTYFPNTPAFLSF
jgi:hypothetical protein